MWHVVTIGLYASKVCSGRCLSAPSWNHWPGCPKDRALVDMAFNGGLVEAARGVSTIRNPWNLGFHQSHRIHGAAIYGNIDPINIPQMLAYIPYMDPMGMEDANFRIFFGGGKIGRSWKIQEFLHSVTVGMCKLGIYPLVISHSHGKWSIYR